MVHNISKGIGAVAALAIAIPVSAGPALAGGGSSGYTYKQVVCQIRSWGDIDGETAQLSIPQRWQETDSSWRHCTYSPGGKARSLRLELYPKDGGDLAAMRERRRDAAATLSGYRLIDWRTNARGFYGGNDAIRWAYSFTDKSGARHRVVSLADRGNVLTLKAPAQRFTKVLPVFGTAKRTVVFAG